MFKSILKSRAAVAVSQLLLGLALSGSAFAGTGVFYIVDPPHPDALALSPVPASILRSTELDTFSLPPATSAREDAATTAPPLRIGLDSYLSGNVMFQNALVSYNVLPELQAQLNLPLVTSTYASANGDQSATGIGDAALTIKYRDHFDDTTDLYYLLTAQLPSGDENKGLGTGAYQFTYAQKLSTWFGPYRTTFMAGVTVPVNAGYKTFDKDKVEYGPVISYMAAVERQHFLPNLWCGLSAAGLHSFNARINDAYQANSLTTLDLIPAVTYYTRGNLGLKLAVEVPVITFYELAGAKNSRDLVVNLGLFKAF